MDQEKRRDGIVNDRKAPNLLVDVEAMTLNDKCFGKIRRAATFDIETYEPKTMQIIGKKMQMHASIITARCFCNTVSILLGKGKGNAPLRVLTRPLGSSRCCATSS